METLDIIVRTDKTKTELLVTEAAIHHKGHAAVLYVTLQLYCLLVLWITRHFVTQNYVTDEF